MAFSFWVIYKESGSNDDVGRYAMMFFLLFIISCTIVNQSYRNGTDVIYGRKSEEKKKQKK